MSFDPIDLALIRKLGGSGGGSGLPSGSSPNQYLVTDGDGNAKWEDKLAWSEEGKVVTWDGSTEGFEVIYNNEVPKFVKISDDIFAKEGLIGVTMVLCSPSDESKTEVVTLTADWLRESADVISIWPKEGAVIANIATTDAVWNGMNFSKGIWAMIPNTGYRLKSLSSPETIHHIDKKYLPSGTVYRGMDSYIYHDADATVKVTRNELKALADAGIPVWFDGVFYYDGEDHKTRFMVTAFEFREDEEYGAIGYVSPGVYFSWAYTAEYVESGPQ